LHLAQYFAILVAGPSGQVKPMEIYPGNPWGVKPIDCVTRAVNELFLLFKLPIEGYFKMGTEKWIVLPGLQDVFSNYIELAKGYLLDSNIVLNRPLLIIGDSGVGKGLFIEAAKQLFFKHYPSRPFVRLNCASFEKGLADSELFGHVKGAFTGANAKKDGIVEIAKGGLLILDEIGELPFGVQAKLLIFIEENEYRRVGANANEYSNLKIIGTTNKVNFRDDFWYRFFPVFIPPLYQRRLDVLYYIAFQYPDIFKRLNPFSSLCFLSHHWPGNMRELERVLSLMKFKSYMSKLRFPCDEDCEFFASGESVKGIDPLAEASLFDEEIQEQNEVEYLLMPEDERQTSLANPFLEKFTKKFIDEDFDVYSFNKVIKNFGLQLPYYFSSEEDAFKYDNCVVFNKRAVAQKDFRVKFSDRIVTYERSLFSAQLAPLNKSSHKYQMGFWDTYYEKLSTKIQFDVEAVGGLEGIYFLLEDGGLDKVRHGLDLLCLCFLKNKNDPANIFNFESIYVDSCFKDNYGMSRSVEMIGRFLEKAL
jgi:hypothetical protein